MKTYLIAHTNERGNGVAQVTRRGASEDNARKWFAKTYPDRAIIAIGIRGKS